jgi:hypothetical protein
MAFDRVSGAFGRLLAGLAFVGCALLLAMLAIIVSDVALRNLAVGKVPKQHHVVRRRNNPPVATYREQD